MSRIIPTICFFAQVAWHREVRQFANPQSPLVIGANHLPEAGGANHPLTMKFDECDPKRQTLTDRLGLYAPRSLP